MRIFNAPAILKNKQFLRLWGNQILLQVAFNMCSYTALLIIANTTHSPFAQAQFYAALTLPAAIFGLVAGGVVDMVDRKRLMLITDLVIVGLFFLYIFVNSYVAPILIIAFLASSVLRFFIPAEAATIPLIVSEDSLEEANALFLFTLLGSAMLGFTIAGPIIQVFGGLNTSGADIPFVIGSIMLLIGFFLVLGLKQIALAKPKVREGTIIGKIFLLFFEMIGEVKVNRRVLYSIMLLVFVELVFGILSIAFLEYVRKYLQLPLTSVSYVLIIPVILGLVVGMILLGKIEKKYGHSKSILASIALTGLLLFCFGLLPGVFRGSKELYVLRIFSICAAFVMGILIFFISVQARTILQRSARKEMYGRVFSFLDVMIALTTPIPVLLIGFIADKVSLLATLVAMGLLIIVMTVVGSKIILGKTIVGR